MPWTVPALLVDTVMLVLGLHDITLPKCVDSSVVCESGNSAMINIGYRASSVTDFSSSAEFSRNFGLKVIYLFCYIKLMLSYAERTPRNLVS